MNKIQAVCVMYLLAISFSACTFSIGVGGGGRGGNSGGPPVVNRRYIKSTETQQMDSLAAISNGDYIHVKISQCFGKCEGYVSLYRESPAMPFIYEAECYIYDEFARDFILQRIRTPIGTEEAKSIFRSADSAGILRFVNDTTKYITDQPYLWMRAKIGDIRVNVDQAYMGGEMYTVVKDGLSGYYERLRRALFAKLAGKK